jgi:mono/diheme cytochrome c family protein
VESKLAIEAKRVTIGGKDWKNPIRDTSQSQKEGKAHFQHHCQICHGMDGHSTGVPFKDKMSPPIVDLSEQDVQDYNDGQLKWIIENGIRFTGMPGWKGILDDGEMWNMVNFMRHLPPKGSEGVPAIFQEEEEQHEQMRKSGAGSDQAPPHQH